MTGAIHIRSCSPAGSERDDVLKAVYGPQVPAAAAAGIPTDHLREFLVAFQAGVPAGCLAVYRNEAIRHEGSPTAQLGAFECTDDPELATALLDAGCAHAAGLQATVVLGPMNGATWNEYRFKTGGTPEPAFFTEMQHPAYYPALWEHAGFSAVSSYVSNLAPVLPQPPDDTMFEANQLTVRGLDPGALEAELDLVYPLCSAAFARSPYYSPVSATGFREKLLPLKPLLDGSLTKIVTGPAGDAVAFILCLPDVLDPARRRIVVKTAAKSPDCAIPGLITALNQRIMNAAHNAGYREAIHAFMHTGNRSLERSRDFAGHIIRTYTLFARPC